RSKRDWSSDVCSSDLKILMKRTPLAIKMRPTHIDEIIGQDHLVGDKQIIRRMVDANSIASMILYDPPVTGKNYMAYAIAESLTVRVMNLNAVISKKKDKKIKINYT